VQTTGKEFSERWFITTKQKANKSKGVIGYNKGRKEEI
jgi:hypothetical protein